MNYIESMLSWQVQYYSSDHHYHCRYQPIMILFYETPNCKYAFGIPLRHLLLHMCITAQSCTERILVQPLLDCAFCTSSMNVLEP